MPPSNVSSPHSLATSYHGLPPLNIFEVLLQRTTTHVSSPDRFRDGFVRADIREWLL